MNNEALNPQSEFFKQQKNIFQKLSHSSMQLFGSDTGASSESIDSFPPYSPPSSLVSFLAYLFSLNFFSFLQSLRLFKIVIASCTAHTEIINGLMNKFKKKNPNMTIDV